MELPLWPLRRYRTPTHVHRVRVLVVTGSLLHPLAIIPSSPVGHQFPTACSPETGRVDSERRDRFGGGVRVGLERFMGSGNPNPSLRALGLGTHSTDKERAGKDASGLGYPLALHVRIC